MPDKDIRNSIVHIDSGDGKRAFATLLSPRYAVCSCNAVIIHKNVNVEGYGHLKENVIHSTAKCIYVSKRYKYQVLELSAPAPNSICESINMDIRGTKPKSMLATFWYNSNQGIFKEVPGIVENFGKQSTNDDHIKIDVGDEKGFYDIYDVRGTPVLSTENKLVGVFVDEPESKEQLHKIVPLLYAKIDGGWYEGLVEPDYNNWKNKYSGTKDSISSSVVEKDFRKEYIAILRQCSEVPNVEFIDEQARIAYELKQGGYINSAEVLDNVGCPVQVHVINVTPQGREYLSKLEKEVIAEADNNNSKGNKDPDDSSSSSDSEKTESSEAASSEEEKDSKVNSTGKINIDPNPVVPNRPSDQEIESSKLIISRDEFTESSFFILNNAFNLADYAAEGWCDEKHLLVECLWVGVTKKAINSNPNYTFITLVKAIGMETEDSLINFLHEKKLLTDSTGLDNLRFINSAAISQASKNISFSSNAKKIINKARDIAQKTSKEKKTYKLHQRHLLTALVLSLKDSNLLKTVFSGLEQKIILALINDINNHYANLASDDKTNWRNIRIKIEVEYGGFIPRIPTGKNTSISRESAFGETCLNAEAYVKVLISVLKGVSGEFCMGLFAPWGRGKTYLVNLLSDSLAKEKELGYQIIRFSAWKYRTTPSLWCHLFETFRAEIFKRRGMFAYLGTGILFNFLKNRYILVWYFFLFSLSVIIILSFMVMTGWQNIFESISIAAILTLSIELFRKLVSIKMRVEEISDKYAKIPTYRNQLGIQELLGNDLKNLIILSTKGTVNGKILNFLKSNLTGENLPDRFLLVVDDLDRCNAEDMLSVIENLMLLLDDTVVKERLHIILIMEEDVLRIALADKYKKMIQLELEEKEKAKKLTLVDAVTNHVVDENIEKFIICYLRLNELTHDEIKECVSKFTIKYTAEKEKVVDVVSTVGVSQKVEYTVEHAARDKTASLPAEKGLSIDKGPAYDKFVYSPDEQMKITEHIEIHGIRNGKRWGPRAIRAFLFKYQLAKLILREMNRDIDPGRILDCFNQAEAETKRAPGEVGDDVLSVVNQVR
ncbi:MAG: P-loop NTPase fold protein [Victivallales bacterium]